MKLQLPESADIQSIEFYAAPEGTAKLRDEFCDTDNLGCRFIEINNGCYVIDNISFEVGFPLSIDDNFRIIEKSKVKVNMDLRKIKGENNE